MTKKFPNLEAVSDPRKLSSTEAQERRRLPRLSLSGEQFRLAQNGKIFAVIDLSQTGMALRVIDPEDFRLFSIAAVIEGQLNVKREKFPITARVRHVRRDSVGCEFESLPAVTEACLKQFLDPETLGRDLRPLPTSGQSTLWYHGPSGTDLLLWRGLDGQYHRLMLYVQGSFIQWEAEGGLSTGSASSSDEISEMHGIVRLETLMLNADFRPDPVKLNIAKSLLLSSNLPEDLKKWCVRQVGALHGST